MYTLKFKHLWLLFHTTLIHILSLLSINNLHTNLSISSLHRLQFLKISNFRKTTETKVKANTDCLIESVLKMTRSLYHTLSYFHILSSKGNCAKGDSSCNPPYNHKHNPNVSCAFHARYIGHSTEDCLIFKARVQELIDHKVLSFSEVVPNVITNPLPDHCGQIMNAVSGEDCSNSIASSEEYQG